MHSRWIHKQDHTYKTLLLIFLNELNGLKITKKYETRAARRVSYFVVIRKKNIHSQVSDTGQSGR